MYEKARSDDTLMPRSVGRFSNVDDGSGRPVQNVLWTIGIFQHGVGMTDNSIKTANANVLTARYRPLMRSAGRPTTTATIAAITPPRGTSNTSGTLSAWCAATNAPTATNAN